MGSYRRMVHLSHFRMVVEEFHHFQRVEHMALYSVAERLHSLQQYECVERRNCCTSVTQQDGTYTGYEGSRSGHICKHRTMITRVWLSQSRELVGICFPVEFSAVYDNSSKRCAMSTQELGSRMHHDVRSVLDRTDHVWGAKRVVNDQWYVVTMSHFSYSINVSYSRIRVSECLSKYRLGVRLYGLFQCVEIVDFHNSVCHTLCCESVGDKVVGSAVEVVSCHNVVASLSNVLKGVCDSSSTACYSQSGHTPFKRGNTVFENSLSGVGQTAVDVTRIAQSETVGCML